MIFWPQVHIDGQKHSFSSTYHKQRRLFYIRSVLGDVKMFKFIHFPQLYFIKTLQKVFLYQRPAHEDLIQPLSLLKDSLK